MVTTSDLEVWKVISTVLAVAAAVALPARCHAPAPLREDEGARIALARLNRLLGITARPAKKTLIKLRSIGR